MNKTAQWLGYEFEVHNPNVTWSDVGGIYIFCGVTPQNTWVPIYIGQAVSLKDRLGNHDRWDEAEALGAICVHAMVVATQAQRDSIEERLIRSYRPHLNTQLK
jgi:excinuclease UvrABC nuclease subunit